jgi:biopolymer transport protein ExbD
VPRRRAKKKGDAPKLEMTPMIDVVFQLLIFFLVTLKQEDILSHLDVSRPAAESSRPPETQPDELLTIIVHKDGFLLQGRRVSASRLERRMIRMAGFNPDMPVIIKCTGDSPHARLIKLLDICANARLTNLSVFSM